MEKLCGIYLITINRPDKLPVYYVGQSINFNSRRNGHIRSLKKGTHRNARLQYLWDKYGSSSFAFSFLDECDIDQIDEYEQWWLDEMHGHERCANISKCAAAPMRGQRFSEEHKAKIGLANLGTVHTADARRNMSESKRGKSNHTQEWLDRLSELMKGEKNHFYGMKHSAETRRVISEKVRARPVTKDVIERARAAASKRAKAVEMVCKRTGIVVKRYNSIGEAARDGYTMSSIISVLHGRLKTHRKHLWRYANP